ncbi:MAG: H/ACA RNA-protein complex protein Gar1 [Candidatus Thermoplasmatota archaeon]|jgi:rRNA processing protein Gar1|nr:H/ACA RNA-protein complex protein Gar1 [Candidatus Thermoplasmatota archaeon]
MPNSLKKVGTVLGVREGKLIAKLNREVQLSTKVFGKEGKPLGKIARLFGPVKAPYAAIDSKGVMAKEIYVR